MCEVLRALAEWLASQLDPAAGDAAQATITAELRGMVSSPDADQGSPGAADKLSRASSGSPTQPPAGVLFTGIFSVALAYFVRTLAR